MGTSSLYNLFAPFYDILNHVPVFGLAREQNAVLDWIKGVDILEVGCGTGFLLAKIAGEGRKVVGLDLSSGMLARARKRLVRLGKEARLIEGSYYEIPFPAQSFDCVVASFTLTHAPDLAPAAWELARVLKPGGRLVTVDVGPPRKPRFGSGAINLVWRMLGDFPRDETAILEDAGLKVVFRRELSKRGTVHLLVARRQSV